MNDLRTGLIRPLEALANDIAVRRHGDPHVAVIVLVSPDSPPQIVVAAADRHDSFDQVRARAKSDPPDPEHEPAAWTISDLRTAIQALDDANVAAMYQRAGQPREPLSKAVEAGWRKRRDSELARHVTETANALRYAAECPHCGQRFTERGLPTHIARSRYCSRAAAQAAGAQ